jgi:hypothetical protein
LIRYPFHRYLRFLVLEGDGVDDIRRHIGAELDYLVPSHKEIEELIFTLVKGRIVDDAWRKKCDVEMFLEESLDMTTCHWIVENGPARAAAERLLLEGVNSRHTAQVLTLKFNHQVSEHAVSLFRRGFWDVDTLSKIEFAEYYRAMGSRKPEPPPAPLKFRSAYTAWEHGELPDPEELTPDDMVRVIAVDAFMSYNKARSTPVRESQEEARRWASVVLKTAQVSKAVGGRGKGDDKGQPSLPGLRAEVYFPESHVPTLAELEAGEAGDSAPPPAATSSSEDDLLDDDDAEQ